MFLPIWFSEKEAWIKYDLGILFQPLHAQLIVSQLEKNWIEMTFLSLYLCQGGDRSTASVLSDFLFHWIWATDSCGHFQPLYDILSKVLLNIERLNVYMLCLLSGVEQLGDHWFLFFTVLLYLKISCYISLCDWIHFYCHDMYCLCQIIVIQTSSHIHIHTV